MIFYRLRRFSVLGLVFLGSCISVNNGVAPGTASPSAAVPNPRAEQIEDKAAAIAQQSPIATIEASGKQCELYKLPPLPARPIRPTAQIAALQEGDDVKLDEIAQAYVKALEQYNSRVSAAVNRSYTEYLARCVKAIPPSEIRASPTP
jgi:hypothetical protein